MRYVILSCVILFFTSLAGADYHNHKEYYPDGAESTKTWGKFYAGEHEPELDDPLIEAGKEMTLVICKAIKNKDMRIRRYAIGVLGYIQKEAKWLIEPRWH